VNVSMAVDHHIVEAIDLARQAREDALQKFVDASRRVGELEAIRDLRMSMGADVANMVRIEPLREAAG
jgi:hypothetical protein